MSAPVVPLNKYTAPALTPPASSLGSVTTMFPDGRYTADAYAVDAPNAPPTFGFGSTRSNCGKIPVGAFVMFRIAAGTTRSSRPSIPRSGERLRSRVGESRLRIGNLGGVASRVTWAPTYYHDSQIVDEARPIIVCNCRVLKTGPSRPKRPKLCFQRGSRSSKSDVSRWCVRSIPKSGVSPRKSKRPESRRGMRCCPRTTPTDCFKVS